MKKEINPTTSSFETLVASNSLYVDKTKYLYELVRKDGFYYFCSRPRRFGKTLTIYTLEAIFKGKRELFKGLYIDKTDYDWKEYPVIHIDFGGCQQKTAKETEWWINNELKRIANDHNVQLDENIPYSVNLKNLIIELSKKGKVVVLIDEYDKPLSSNIYSPEIESIRDVLRGFFEILKASPDYIHFVFITGVTKYAKVSIFSSMNNLMDISMTEQYANMFGYTQEELELNFSDYIDDGCKATGLTRSEYLSCLKKKYDGYCFCPNTPTIYNPVSIGSFFAQGGRVFENYWVSTGGGKLLFDIAKRVSFDLVQDLKRPISKTLIASYDIVEMASADTDSTLLKSLLFQSGYLTIVGARGTNNQSLMLDFPNDEVRECFTKSLMSVYIGARAEHIFSPYDLMPYFDNGDTTNALELIKSIYASVPNEIGKNLNESSYHLAFYCMMRSCGANIDAEVSTNKGRIDAVLINSKHVYIIEFKINKSADEALLQIKDKAYFEQYNAWKNTHKVHLVGINFSTEERNITEYKEEII